MKERIYKIIIALVLLVGFLTIMSLIKSFAPWWVTWSLLGLVLVYILYDVSKPDKKPKETYWYYSYIGARNGQIFAGYGVQRSNNEEFDFVGYMYGIPICHITMVKQISKEQYIKLSELINLNDKDNQKESC